MKLSKLMQFLFFGLSMNMGIVDDNGGGGGSDEAAAAADAAAAEAATAAAAADKDGKKPTDEEARLLKENMAKKEQLRKAADEKLALEAKLKQFEGIDPEAVRKLLDSQKAAEQLALEQKGDWERLKANMAKEHADEMAALRAQLDEKQANLGKASTTINDLSVGSKFGQSTFIADELTLTPGKARVIYGDHFDIAENGDVVGYDKPRGAANRTAIVDQYGNPVAFDTAMRKIVEADPEKDHLLKSKVKPGAGSDSKKPSGSAGAAKPAAEVSSISKIAQGLASLPQAKTV